MKFRRLLHTDMILIRTITGHFQQVFWQLLPLLMSDCPFSVNYLKKNLKISKKFCMHFAKDKISLGLVVLHILTSFLRIISLAYSFWFLAFWYWPIIFLGVLNSILQHFSGHYGPNWPSAVHFQPITLKRIYGFHWNLACSLIVTCSYLDLSTPFCAKFS